MKQCLKALLTATILCSVIDLPANAQSSASPATAISETQFSWELAKKTISRAYPAGRFRPISIVGYQSDGPSKVSAYVHFEGGGPVRVSFVELITDSGRKWFLVPAGGKEDILFLVE
jgi:hypothetical protein